MTIYQVINEQNCPVVEFDDLLTALREAEKRNISDEDHYFYVETATLKQ